MFLKKHTIPSYNTYYLHYNYLYFYISIQYLFSLFVLFVAQFICKFQNVHFKTLFTF